MDAKDKDAAITLGISIPVDPSKQIESHLLQMKTYSTFSLEDNSQSSEALFQRLQFYNLPSSLDPNLGIIGELPTSNISYEKSTFNSWNIEPHFLHTLPLSSTDSYESCILVFGGLNPSSVLKKISVDFDHDDFVLGSTIFQYLLNSGQWKYFGTMIEPRCYHACALDGQYVYITGGYSLLKREHGEMIAISSTDRLNLNNRQWKRCANMITPRASHAIVSHKACLYVFGGRSSFGNILSSVEMYSPDQDTWTEITSLPQPTMGLSTACTMNTIWILGGITYNSSGDPSKCFLSNVYSFIPSIKRWCKEESLPQACAFSSCVSNDYSLWLIGGCTFSKISEKDNVVSCSSIFEFSLSVKPSKWRTVASLLHPRHALTAVLHDERIYVLAGMESTNNCASTVVEVINTRTNTNIECTNIPVPIAGCYSIVLQDLTNYQYMKCGENHTQENSSTILCASYENCVCDSNTDVYLPESDKTFNILENICQSDRKEYTDFLPSDNSQLEIEECSNETFHERTKKSKDYFVNENIREIILKHENLDEKEVKNTHLKANEEKVDDNQTLRYRASMEIFLNDHLLDNEISPSFSKRNNSALKWLKYFDTLSASDEELHIEVFESKEPKLNVTTEIDNTKLYETSKKSTAVKHFEEPINSDINKASNLKGSYENLDSTIPSSVRCHQSFSYVQSSLNSQSLDSDSNVKDFDDKKHMKSFDGLSTLKIERERDNLRTFTPSDNEKMAINEDSFPIILLMGGECPVNSNKGKYILSYYCNKNIWNYAGFMPEYRCHHCSVYFNNKIYVIGGFNSENSRLYENITKTILCYDIHNETWYHAASMNYSRAYHSAVIMENEIHVLGGRNELGNILASVEAYNESKNEWRECKSLPYPVLGTAASISNGVLYVFGGITYKDQNEIISSKTSIFDAENNSWSVGPVMHTPLAFCGISTFSNLVWLFGGLEEKDGDIVSKKDIFKFDTLNEIWRKVAELSLPRHASITVSLGTNVYIIGGHSTQEKQEVLTCELVDVLKNEISIQKQLPVAASGRTGVVVKEVNKSNMLKSNPSTLENLK